MDRAAAVPPSQLASLQAVVARRDPPSTSLGLLQLQHVAGSLSSVPTAASNMAATRSLLSSKARENWQPPDRSGKSVPLETQLPRISGQVNAIDPSPKKCAPGLLRSL